MMSKSQRSRACKQCRERRVKCDETPVICQHCRRLHLECSGPIQGSVIIDMTDRVTDRVTKHRQRKKRELKVTPEVKPKIEPVEPILPKFEVQTPNSERAESPTSLQIVPQYRKPPTAAQWSEVEVSYAIATIRYQYRLPALHQPSNLVPEALDLAFITHFVQLNHGERTYTPEIPWITHLPNLQQNATKPALRLAIRAASMAFYATVHRDTTILVDSYRWYTKSLNSQRSSLAKLSSHSIPSSEEILVPILLSLYEVFAGTTSTSIWHHLSAAANIIAMRGPENCKGSSFPLFKAIRVSDAHTSMVFNTPSIFATPAWMTMPFEFGTKNAHQILADILLLIPGCISLCKLKGGSMRTFFATPIPPTVDLRPVEQRTRELLQRVKDWASRFPNLTQASNGKTVVYADVQSLAINGARSPTPDKTHVILPDSFIALTAATYEAIRLILSLLLDKVSVGSCITPTVSVTSPASASFSSYTSPLMENAVASSKAVLNISSYMEMTHPVGFDFMRSVFPLVVVATIGPQLEEQRRGEKMLERWGNKRGMSGLCAAWLHA